MSLLMTFLAAAKTGIYASVYGPVCASETIKSLVSATGSGFWTKLHSNISRIQLFHAACAATAQGGLPENCVTTSDQEAFRAGETRKHGIAPADNSGDSVQRDRIWGSNKTALVTTYGRGMVYVPANFRREKVGGALVGRTTS